MIPNLREEFNRKFTDEKYQELLNKIKDAYGVQSKFRIAESPFFIPKILKERLLDACSQITEFLTRSDIKKISQGALYDKKLIVPNEDKHTTFLQVDFGVTHDENGDPYPMLIEIQGFPSVYFFQYLFSRCYKEAFDLPENLTSYFHHFSEEEYKNLLREIIIGDTDPKQVVLLEIEPEKQTTYIDMAVTAAELGLKVLCVTKVIKNGNKLFYKDDIGNEIEIRRIYNRVIFDELYQRDDLKLQFSFQDDLDIKWVGHPNWFTRISKYIMPQLKNKYVPETRFLHEIEEIPSDLDNYVLKPLFSFAGAGVIIDVTKEDIEKIDDNNKSNFVLQRKVTYHPVLKSPNEPVKVEIRMMLAWPDNNERPIIINNLVRLSKGKMIGVKYNMNKDWVGASVGLFEK